MAHERREARLAAAPVHLLAQHRAVERECDLGGERAHNAARSALEAFAVARDQHDRGAGAARRERRRAARGYASAAARRRAPRRGEAHERLAVVPRRRPAAGRERCPGGDIPVAPTASTRNASVVVESAQRDDAPGRASAAAVRTARPGRSPRASVAATSSAPAPLSSALALERAVLLAHEPGHANDDEPEQRDRRDADDGVVQVAVARCRG